MAPGAKKSAFSNHARADDRLDAQVEQFWKLETGEALANSLPMLAVDDKKTVDICQQSVEQVHGYYQIDILFGSKDPNLPDNRVIAEKRL